ncbi:P-loop containing nucleoside triphosphate hydrolase protein [Phaeosphaeria sp. MPI-PUGE-AT-0046c]|nr:P-loop containing nucleoside triphosphate hydrolase protein [Phaeosphaeria sp. MPI-PUGE-AT-0046c]
MASLQTPLLSNSWAPIHDTTPIWQCHKIWDADTARFTPCFLPFITAVPAIVAALTLLTYALRVLEAYRPTWTKPFVQEPEEKVGDVGQEQRHQPMTATLSLLVITFIGLGLQTMTVFIPGRQMIELYPSIAWGFTVITVILERPRTASASLLLLFFTLLGTELVVLSHTPHVASRMHGSDVPAVLLPIAALAGIIVILNMPMRDPMLSNAGISPVYGGPTMKLRTPEDNLTPWQYMTVAWMSPLIQEGYKKQLDNEDVWDLPYTFKHELLHRTFRTLSGSVTRRLLIANGMDLIRTMSITLVRLLATLSTPVLLQRLLASMRNGKPASVTITYAILTVALRLLSAQLGVFNLWYQRRSYERSRGEMITMLYEKTLNRKIMGAKQELKDENGNDQSLNGEINVNAEPDNRKRQGFLTRLFAPLRAKFTRQPKKVDKAKAAASMGRILNLMRNDVYEVSQRFWDVGDIITQPAGAVLATILVWQMLGWACLLGVVALAASQLVNIAIARLQIYFEKKRRVATDEKLQKTTQFIESIRHLRWYGWQDSWMKGILDSRQEELHYRLISIILTTSLAFMLRLGSGLFPAVAFFALTKWEGKALRVDLIFPAIDLFNMLEGYLRALPQLVTTLLNAYIAMGRIEEFMSEPDKEQAVVVPEESAVLGLQGASFAWPGVHNNVLEDITVSFPRGLTVVYGEVAAGKTALLQALLGELDQRKGGFIQPDQIVGYCAQTPWLQSMNIRENILFNEPYHEARYKQVLEACALLPDIAEFKHGDLSNIGENGIGLSGGQKARVALARAIYSSANVVLLDDPLSALDHQTAEFIVKKLLAGPLLRDRTTILVTHRTELCRGLAKQWVEIQHGRVTVHEPPTDWENGSNLEHTVTNESMSEEEAQRRKEQEAAAIPDKFIEDEHRTKGGVKLSIYWRYIKAGTLKLWFVGAIVMLCFRVIDVGRDWFLKAWGESYETDHPKTMFDFLPPAPENVVPWLETFFLFAAATSVLFWWTLLIMFAVGYRAAKTIFEEAVKRVAHATFRYYDVTPVGRLMNRLTSDMNTVDGGLSSAFTIFAWQSIGWATAVTIILSSTPAFLAFGALLCCCFVYYFFRFLPTSQSLRRLEMVSLSPLMSNFGALVEGLTTVRAFKAQSRFQKRVIEVADQFQKHDHFYWSLQSWLGLRFSVLSASSTLVMTLIAIYVGISPGLTAFVLVTANSFVMYTEGMCRIYGQLEMDFTSVERVIELLDVEKEEPGVVEPPAYWPTFSGDIEFEDATIRYAPNLEPALQNVTLRIPAGSNTAVIGRTGSGKSTLALSLLATIAAESGTIRIDGVDISTVNKQALRSRVTFLAQEPVLFPGSMRKNLDPLDEYSDAACESVLSKIAGNHNWTLSTNIEGGGKGLSQGQRQLVGLARAMLRRSPVLIMDEATASIDFETAQRIQSVLREEMRQSTVITIAHRLEAVKNADYCVVLGKGKLVKAGKAADMLKEGSEFSGMLA